MPDRENQGTAAPPSDVRRIVLATQMRAKHIEGAPAVSPPRRCYVTLVVRGAGSYVTPQHQLQPLLPDYVSTAIPLLCSHQRVVSRYPLLVLAVNLTHKEHAVLRDHGAVVHDLTEEARRQHSLLPAAAPSCTLDSKGAWQVWGRGDFAQTMVKVLLWKALATLGYDEAAFVDADSIFLSSADSIFDALNPPLLGKQFRAHRTLSLRDMGRCKRPGSPESAFRHRRLCPRLRFAARFSSRLELSKEWTRPGQRAQCAVPGWQTGFFVTRPSQRTFDALQQRASHGNFTTFTKTEQDVLDAEFAIRDHCLPLRAAREPLDACVAHAYLQHELVEQLVLHHRIHSRRDVDEHVGTLAIQNLSLALCRSRAGLDHLPQRVPVAGSSPKCQHRCRELHAVNAAAAMSAAFGTASTELPTPSPSTGSTWS